MEKYRIKINLSFAVGTALILAVVLGLMLPVTFIRANEREAMQPGEDIEKAGSDIYSLSGPYTCKNLTIFLVHADAKDSNAKFMTLQEALSQKKAIVTETGTVNTLSIENVSGDVHIYIQSGDIVRGGKQDRTLGSDYVIGPKSGKIPISSFCVERGRWQKRGNEGVNEFSVSNRILPSKGLKIAANYNNSQRYVWDEVDSFQNKLSSNLGKSVKSEQSASSLQLTLEDKDVDKAVQEYINLFSNLVKNGDGAVGFAFAINGKVEGAEIYSSRELFEKLWPKLLQACSLEAVAEMQKTEEFVIPAAKDFRAFLQDDEKAEISEKLINEQLKLVTRLSKERIVFETYSQGRRQALHKSYIRADKDSLRQGTQSGTNSRIRQHPSVLNRQQTQEQRR
jgi:hypothetical protein